MQFRQFNQVLNKKYTKKAGKIAHPNTIQYNTIDTRQIALKKIGGTRGM